MTEKKVIEDPFEKMKVLSRTKTEESKNKKSIKKSIQEFFRSLLTHK